MLSLFNLTRSISFFAEPGLDGVDFEDLVPGGLDQLLGLLEVRLHDGDVTNPQLEDGRGVLMALPTMEHNTLKNT